MSAIIIPVSGAISIHGETPKPFKFKGLPVHKFEGGRYDLCVGAGEVNASLLHEVLRGDFVEYKKPSAPEELEGWNAERDAFEAFFGDVKAAGERFMPVLNELSVVARSRERIWRLDYTEGDMERIRKQVGILDHWREVCEGLLKISWKLIGAGYSNPTVSMVRLVEELMEDTTRETIYAQTLIKHR